MNAVRTYSSDTSDTSNTTDAAPTGAAAGAATGAARSTGGTGQLSHEARNIQWLLQNFVEEVPGVHSVAVVSSDGLLLLTSHTEDAPITRTVPEQGRGGPAQAADNGRMDLAAVVSGLASLTAGAARLMDGGPVRQTTVAMEDGMLLVTSISDGSLLGVHATADCDITVIGYHMALFVGRVGHVLTPALRTELRQALGSAG